MSILSIPGGTFDVDRHIYRDEQGKFVPSLTQVLHLCGFYNYHGVKDDVMETAAKRGTMVHACAEMHARFGAIDETWLTDELAPYVDAYLKFLVETNFTPEVGSVEQPMVAIFCGMKYGVKPDLIGKRNGGGPPTVIELKATATAQPDVWAVQTLAQAIAKFGEHRYAEARRHALMLRPDGNYRLLTCDKTQRDVNVFRSALTCVWFRLDAGQKLEEVV